MASIVKDMFKKNTDSFFYVTNYFVKAVQTLEDRGIPLQQIEQIYKQVLERLNQLHEPAPRINTKNKGAFEVHKSVSYDDFAKKTLTLKRFSSV